MLTPLNSLLTKYPAISPLLVLFLFASNSYMSHEVLVEVTKISKKCNEYPAAVIEASLVNAASDSEIIASARQWQVDGWGAQIGAVNVLCIEPDRKSLASTVGKDLATDMCRIVK